MKINLGLTMSGGKEKQIGFDLDTLITTRLLIQANSGGGKSYLLRKFMEQLFGHIQVIAIDPEGEFATLREKFGYVLIGKGGETAADVRTAAMVAERLLQLHAPAVCDLYEMRTSDRHEWVKNFLEALVNAPKKLWHPMIVIVDEAHIFCPEKGQGESPAKESMIDLNTRGRKRGFCPVWATQRLSKVDKNATAELLNRLVGGTFEDVDVDRAVKLMGVAAEDKAEFVKSLKTLEPGEFYAFGRAISKERILFKVGQVETSHPKPGSAKHAAEAPPAPDTIKDLLPKLADLPKEAEEKARTVQDLKQQIANLKRELGQAKKSAPAVDQTAIDRHVAYAIEQAKTRYEAQWRKQIGLYEGRIEKLTGALRKLGEYVAAALTAESSIAQSQAMTETPRLEVKAPGIVAVAQPKQLKPPVSRVAAVSHVSHISDTSNGEVTRPQLKILQALAMFESIQRSPVSKKWVAALAGVSHTSSAYTNNLGALRSKGLIDYPAPGAVALTESGRSMAPVVDTPADPQEMLQRCREIVSGPQFQILEALFTKYPQPVEKKELAELVGVSPTSSAYTNNLGSLRSAGMIDYPAQGTAKCADWIFLE